MTSADINKNGKEKKQLSFAEKVSCCATNDLGIQSDGTTPSGLNDGEAQEESNDPPSRIEHPLTPTTLASDENEPPINLDNTTSNEESAVILRTLYPWEDALPQDLDGFVLKPPGPAAMGEIGVGPFADLESSDAATSGGDPEKMCAICLDEYGESCSDISACAIPTRMLVELT